MTNDRLYQTNPQERFSDRAEDYAKYRPSYPAEAIDCILEGLSEPSQLIAADIGAGTGISSRLLAERGVKVIAIEPNAAMRVDIVTCFQQIPIGTNVRANSR